MKIPAPALVLCLASLLPAQVQVFGGPGARRASTYLAFGKDFEIKAGICIQHGQPVWKPEYDDEEAFQGFLDTYRGKLLRLGKDWWTTFDTTAAVGIGGTEIPAGSYYLGLSYHKDGTFRLAVIDAATAMKNKEMPFVPERWTVAYEAPLEFRKNASEETVKDMTIDLIANDRDPSRATFQVAWGRHRLVAGVSIPLEKTAGASAAKKGRD
ncbi:MAG: hypothetical protein Fur0037_18120 [Planctomycetota bacterium]